MTPEETARETADGIATIGSHFMLDRTTYGHGASIGFSGIDFYVTGRGGVLGPVDASVVTSAFFFWTPAVIEANWQPDKADYAAGEFAGCAHRWAEEHVPDDLDAARLGELAGRVVTSASVAGAPVFAGWRRLPVPDAPQARALHHLNGLRELRGALHGGAVLAAGLRPVEAVLLRQPHMAPLFGYPEPDEDVAAKQPQWDEAEAGTNRAIAPAFEALDPSERAELTELVAQLHAATSS